MQFDKIQNIYLIGIGGIGMSALARYFLFIGKNVAGYDKTKTSLTDKLSDEGIAVHYTDDPNLIPAFMIDNADIENTLVIYTPAIPEEHKELTFFKKNNFTLLKRSEVLGMISRKKTSIAVAGTHGKTTISSMIAHLLYASEKSCNAFLGGISKNYNTNLLLSESSPFVVAEADEFDRSFLHLEPQIAIISAVDADHLDIYGTYEEVKKSFSAFVEKIQTNGSLIIKKGINIELPKNKFYHIYKYSLNSETDFFARNIKIEANRYVFDFITPLGTAIESITCGIPGIINVENAVAALAAAFLAGVPEKNMRDAMHTFKGNNRRFDIQVETNNIVYIDDYAHHPEEIKAFISSVKEMYPGKKITGIFQPHLFSRTKDFADDFAKSLSMLDELILTEIYPAREKAMPGVTSELIFDKVSIKNKILCSKTEITGKINKNNTEVLLTMGAGDIDLYVSEIKQLCLNA